MEIRYQLTTKDAEIFNLIHIRRSPTVRREIFAQQVALSLIFAILGAFALLASVYLSQDGHIDQDAVIFSTCTGLTIGVICL